MIKTIPTSDKIFDSKLSPTSRLIRLGFRFADRYVTDLSKYGPFSITASREKKFLWFSVPKSGSSSILTMLDDAGVTFEAVNAHQSYYLPSYYQSWFKFAFVRNPWDRLVSAWLDKVIKNNLFNFSPAEHQNMQDFSYFVDNWVAKQDLNSCDGHLRQQTRLFPTTDIDFIGRLENFEADVNFVKEQINLPALSIKRINRSQNRKNYQEYYTPELAEKVGQLYAFDIKYLNYTF
jgi:hypothetical protein